ncbi:hypothetical protein KIN20_020188 [Parelaphostrongylus tenuis]|uniref:Uncharacterized protein n=1 Tax=Parelaphostrongylus tenuis TaxID=148309 RepID=A0AAD5MM32_PARTN|nr:hypothetical protein KIN20_020188 [Parelaphostrongylus tenuis]
MGALQMGIYWVNVQGTHDLHKSHTPQMCSQGFLHRCFRFVLKNWISAFTSSVSCRLNFFPTSAFNFGPTLFPIQHAEIPAEDPSPKSIPWKRQREDLKPLLGYVRKPWNIICATNNIPFGIRAEVRTTSEGKPSQYLSLHRAQKHNNKDFDVTVTILAQESKTATPKTLEAFWINAKNPEMNRKDEFFITARDLTPFLRLIF